MKEVPEHLRRDAGWRAALVILESPWFRHRRAVWEHVHPETGDLFFEHILEAIPWSSTEELLLRAAASLYNGDVKVDLYKTLAYLDDNQLVLFLRAIDAFTSRPGAAVRRL